MYAKRSFTDVLTLILAAIASKGFQTILTTQRPQSYYCHRASLHLNGRGLGISGSVFLSQLLNLWNTDVAAATANEHVSTPSCPNTIKKDEHSISVSKPMNTNTNPITVEDVELPGHVVVDNQILIRNGHGLRSITYFGIGIRIYVAAMYSAVPILSVEQIMGNASEQDQDNSPTAALNVGLTSTHHNGPLQLDFTFLRYVRQYQVVSAWQQQLDHSVTYRDYGGYEADRDRFIELASGGPIEKYGTQSVQLVGDEVRIIDQGKLVGVIHGRNFQRSFLSMWFGSMAVAEDLKANLLRGDEHNPAEMSELRRELEQDPKRVLIKA